MTRSKRSSHRASLGWAGSWSPYTTACVKLLEDNMFNGLDRTRILIVAWSRRYNEKHPHSAGWLSPNQYARQWAHHQ